MFQELSGNARSAQLAGFPFRSLKRWHVEQWTKYEFNRVHHLARINRISLWNAEYIFLNIMHFHTCNIDLAKCLMEKYLSSIITNEFHKIFIKISNWNRHFPNGFIYRCPISKYCFSPPAILLLTVYNQCQFENEILISTSLNSQSGLLVMFCMVFSLRLEFAESSIRDSHKLKIIFFCFKRWNVSLETQYMSKLQYVKPLWWSISIISNRFDFVSKH